MAVPGVATLALALAAALVAPGVEAVVLKTSVRRGEEANAAVTSSAASGSADAQTLPETQDLLVHPSETFARISGETQRLTSELDRAQMNAHQHEEELKADLTRQVKRRLTEVDATRAANAALRQQTAALQAEVTSLHGVAKRMDANRSQMLAEMRALRQGLNSSRDLAAAVLNGSQGLDDAPEMSILSELEAREAEQLEAAFLQRKRRALSLPVSLLQETETPGKKTSDLLVSMTSALEDLSREQKTEEKKLRAQFQRRFDDLAATKAGALSEQAQLNATLAATADVAGKLKGAISYLGRSNDALAGKLRALKLYLHHLTVTSEAADSDAASRGAPATKKGGVSLLQVEAQKSAASTSEAKDLPDPLASPLEIFSDLGSHVSNLAHNLDNLRRKQEAEVTATKRALDDKLRQQEQASEREERTNSLIAKEIHFTNGRVQELRQNASALEQRNDDLRGDIKILQTNITTALEFMQYALNQTNDSVESTPELAVLAELDRKDAKEAAEQKSQARMDEIEASTDADAPTAALLQLRSAHVNAADPTAILGSLASSLENSTQEQAGRLSALRSLFDAAWQRGVEHKQLILAEQARLNSTLMSQGKIVQRLNVAIARLQEIGQGLLHRREALRSFLRRVSHRPAPVPDQQAPAHTQEIAKTALLAEQLKTEKPQPKATSLLAYFFPSLS
eukprot:TRINITY_DN62728_c0_g1_i1.p1 TRINITY_DN62728_c0_g1~~TRINITY_DN62728_c0_g1_i1.p1  ORF type:complete len:685 (+),score=199.85 TRINITY_DN62728_c0_g1_i1:77-2131(+)